jgi:hypothetical protein
MEWASILTNSGLETRLWEFLNRDFFLQLVATLMGALLAFFFGLKLYEKQKWHENQATLHFLIAALSSLSNNLYALKEQIVQHRYKECMDCKKTLETSSEPNLQIRHMSEYIYCGDFEWPIAQEKLGFLATPDPNVILLAGALSGSINTFNTIVSGINEDTKRYMRGEKKPDLNDVRMMISNNEL